MSHSFNAAGLSHELLPTKTSNRCSSTIRGIVEGGKVIQQTFVANKGFFKVLRARTTSYTVLAPLLLRL